jgi:hypothetical protein
MAEEREQAQQAPEKPKWTMERVRDEIYQARTKMFVVAKVLETGAINPAEHPEWVLVIKPLLRDLVQFSDKIRSLIEPPQEGGTKQE